MQFMPFLPITNIITVPRLSYRDWPSFPSSRVTLSLLIPLRTCSIRGPSLPLTMLLSPKAPRLSRTPVLPMRSAPLVGHSLPLMLVTSSAMAPRVRPRHLLKQAICRFLPARSQSIPCRTVTSLVKSMPNMSIATRRASSSLSELWPASY